MKCPSSLTKLVGLSRLARPHIESLAKEERREVGEPDWHLGNVKGYCGIAARYIELLANNVGIYPVFVVGCFRVFDEISKRHKDVSGHAWLEHQGHIVDVTVDQFGCMSEKVLVCKDDSLHYSKFAVGRRAKEVVSGWYNEPLDEICQKVQGLV